MLIKSGKGYKIKLESGRILPKVYPTREAGNRRIRQLKAHSKK